MVCINGIEKNGCDNRPLLDVIEAEGYRVDQIAVEINGEVIPKSMYERTVIRGGDRIEVVSFVGGG